MERCDFSSISTCLKNQISESNQMNQPDFLYELFEDFMNDPINEDFSMDNGLICRWITGQAKISPKITSYYAKPSNQKKLATTIQRNLLPLMADCNMVIQDIYTLFIQDDTISDTKKQELVSLYKPSDSRLLFLAKVLSFGMERQFIKRDTRNQKLIAGGVLSPIVLDYIMDSEVPKPCRHFLGREEELDELHTLFEENRHIFLYGIAGIGKSELAKAYAEFQRRIKDQGLEDYLTVELMDYRDLPKKEYQFDRVVSVGMLEHVGRDNYQLFLDCVEKVLKPGGLFLLHFISALKEHPGDPWVKKYIFPGGTVPSLREILNHMAEDNFHTLDIENLRLHYNKTLLHWEKNFRDNIEKEKTMFDEEFLRMWDLYLSACAATFHNGIIDLHQILMTKGVNNDLPMTRWY